MSFPTDPNAIPREAVSNVGRHNPSPSEADKNLAGYSAVAIDDDATPRIEYPGRKLDIPTILTDLAAVALPLAMVVYVVALWRLDGAHVVEDSHGSWLNAITVLATAFPILFASIVGRLMSEAARWKLERGATVGVLEQLMGSRTVGATALTMIEFRSLNILSVLLLLVWAMSPLGAQSLLRVVGLRVDKEVEPSTAVYFDSSAESKLVEWADTETRGFSGPEEDSNYRFLASLYLSSVMASEAIKLDTMDLWGNVKIPILSELKGGWVDTPQEASLIQYSFLAGVPINNAHTDANTTLSVESEYVHLDCSNLTMNTFIDPRHPINSEVAFVGIESGMLEDAFSSEPPSPYTIVGAKKYQLPNGTWHGFNNSKVAPSWGLSLDRFVDPLWTGDNDTVPVKIDGYRYRLRFKVLRPALFADEDGIEAGSTNLRFDALCKTNEFTAKATLRTYCRVTQRYVESRVLCSRGASTRQNCRVVAHRPSQMKHATRDISDLSFPTVFRLISRELPRTIGGSASYQKEASLYYLQDPTLRGLKGSEENFLGNVTAGDISVRLAQLLNTYLQLSKLYVNVAGGSAEGAAFEPNITTAAKSARDVVLYDISGPWAALCLAASAVLLGAGLLSVVFKHKAKGPEVLGHASTVLRDSRYVDLDPGSKWMDGMKLSRSMKGQRIRFGLVRTKDNGEQMIGVGSQHETDRIDSCGS
ncbi:hypothetical protein CSOJ01_11249 [Colletotrichum sojae]|uniref:Uncharacterized protein n=1 Tax=Colletotrichum sojae TaxID=2175907 RepID=A0A8H6MNB8_9PEZI|nr:hypothetical protein CSOJ01_11249 [Colletotrichum sojae]